MTKPRWHTRTHLFLMHLESFGGQLLALLILGGLAPLSGGWLATSWGNGSDLALFHGSLFPQQACSPDDGRGRSVASGNIPLSTVTHYHFHDTLSQPRWQGERNRFWQEKYKGMYEHRMKNRSHWFNSSYPTGPQGTGMRQTWSMCPSPNWDTKITIFKGLSPRRPFPPEE